MSIIILQDQEGANIQTREQGGIFDALGQRLREEFNQADQQRRPYEREWIKDLRQYLGIYDPEVLEKLKAGQARTFVKETRKKVRTADARMRDLLFPAGRRSDNWSIKPTEEPKLAPKDEMRLRRHLQRQRAMMAKEQGQNVDPRTVQVPEEELDKARVELARQKADAMRTTMSDQLGEMRYPEIAERVMHSGHVYGFGVLKGPMPDRRVVPGWEYDPEQGGWVAVQREENRPYGEHAPVWSFYPDMTADWVQRCRYVYQEHLMPKHEAMQLAGQHGFVGSAIARYLAQNPEGDAQEKTHEQEIRNIRDQGEQPPNFKGYYRLLERWGWISVNDLEQCGCDMPEGINSETVGEVFVNVWMIGELVIRASLEPTYHGQLPYFIYYNEKGDGNLLDCEGWPRIMRDDQTLLNASTRAMLDNAKASAGPQVEVETGLLEGQQDVTFEPWKAYYRNQKAHGVNRDAIRFKQVGNYTSQFGEIIALAERWGHEHTLPAYMEGQNSPHAGGAADTARGLSMLMSAANIEIKDLARNFDEGVTEPFIRALYRWNMEWSEDDSIKGDYQVYARGSTSLMAKEVRAQQAQHFVGMMQGFEDWIESEKYVHQVAEVTEMQDAVLSRREHDERMQNQPPSPERMKAQADVAEAQRQMEEARASAMENRAQAIERLASALESVRDPDRLLQFLEQMGVSSLDDIGAGQQRQEDPARAVGQ